MLTWLRDNAKIFLIATIVIFVALIFLRWGMGEGDNRPDNPYERAIATVDGEDIMPDEYQAALQNWNLRYRQMLEQSGNPDTESMLLLMSAVITEEAYKELINSKLEGIYLDSRNWTHFTVGQAEALLAAQVRMQDLGGMSAEEYLDMVKSEQPGLYQQYLYQTYAGGDSRRFPLASGMVSMASREEVDFLLLNSQGQITARYVILDTIPPIPDEKVFEEFYNTNPEMFSRPAGSLLRYVTIQIAPKEDDLQFAAAKLDSLSYATAGSPITATRMQFLEYYGDGIILEEGQRTVPFLGMYSNNPSISSYHVLLLDSVITSSEILDDTLHLRSWEVPVLPQYSTIRSTMWTVEQQMENILANSIPDIGDSLLVIDFGEILVEEDTPLTGSISEEIITFATDTLWPDSIGPIFYSPGYRGGYPAFTLVRRLEFYPSDTIGYEEAVNSGTLQEMTMYSIRREITKVLALEALNEIHSSGANLGAWAASESLQVYTTATFTASQIRADAESDPDAVNGILSSVEFAEAAVVAPEFQVIGPFSTGTSCVLAEILSRQVPPENPSMTTMTYVATQQGHEELSRVNIIQYMRETSEIRDLRDEWQQYAEAAEDSIRTEREQMEDR
ncbi:MAG: peptidyl-prolyl cis-trans isomerase [Candidatus Aegiribacteria sp.]|nr:peptidyl-prolyl cis-trans isomerase [Candidatus Aegiribacteria sp.]